MEFKKSIIILIMAVFLVSIAGVCAVDANDTMVTSEDNSEIDQTTDDVIGVGEDTVSTSSEENEILSEGVQSFSKLNETINGNTNKSIYLNDNYNYSTGDDSFKDGIVINRDVNIYGNGAIIDGNNQARIFQINGGNVVFYNITFINGNAGEDYGGAINGNSKAINCTFKQNHAEYGGAISGGSAVNCNFSRNAARWGGAISGGSAVNCNFSGNDAIYGGAMVDSSAVNCTFSGNAATYSGAMSGGSAVNCTFSGNAARWGGAMLDGSAVNCTFSRNNATDNGGAMYKGSAVDCTFFENTASLGGAMYEGYKWNCAGQDAYYFTMNLLLHWDANDFTTSYGSDEKVPIQLRNIGNNLVGFINYDVAIYEGGAYVKIYHCLSNDWLSIDLPIGIYTAKLMVTYPGLDKPEPKNITLTVTDGTTFTDLNKAINDNTKDTITLDKDYTFNSTFDSAFREGIVINRPVTINGMGYAIDAQGKATVFYVNASDVTIKNLTIKNGYYGGNGGAVYFVSYGNVTNCNFAGNKANHGGAVYFANQGNVTDCNFAGNDATSGGAVYFNKEGSVTNCIFTNNKATDGGAINMCSGNVTNCNFINNQATGEGSAIYCYKLEDNLINGSVFINNTENIIFVMIGGNITTINSWFGNNATNYNIRPEAGNVTMDNWLFLNATADSNAVPVFNSTGIVFKLYIYNAASQNVSEYNNTLLMPINLTITSANGYVDNPAANLGNSIRYAATHVGEGSVTAKIKNVVCTIALNNIKAKTELVADAITATYNINRALVITLKDANGNPVAGVDVSVDLNGVKNYVTDVNGQVKVSTAGLAPKTYTAKVIFKGNTNYLGSSAAVKVIIKKAKPKIVAKKKTFKSKKKTKKFTITLKGNTGKAIKKVKVTLKIKGKKLIKAKTNSKGKATFNIKNLKKAGKFKAKIKFKGNKYYNKATKTIRITIK